MLKELNDDVEKSRKLCINTIKISMKRKKTLKERKNILELKSIVTQKKFTEGMNRTFKQEEGRIDKLEDKTMEITESKD